LNNSNVDWGQDLLALARWKQQRASSQLLNLAYFGRVNPRHAGIEYRLPPRAGRDDAAAEMAASLKPGWYAISVTLLQGRRYMVETPEGKAISTEEGAFAYFQQLQPVDQIGHSIFIYNIGEHVR
jgi:hypothetical protein